jgi:hypothetical protein
LHAHSGTYPFLSGVTEIHDGVAVEVEVAEPVLRLVEDIMQKNDFVLED